MSTQVTHRRRTGDTIKKLSVVLQSTNVSGVLAAEDLTGATVTFSMVNAADDSVKVSASAAVVDDAATGQVSYTFASGDVDTAGIFYGSFTKVDSGADDTFPVRQKGLRILIDSDIQTAEEAYQAAISA